MAKWGKFDFSEFEKLAKAFQQAQKTRVIERFIRDFLLEMALGQNAKLESEPLITPDI